MTPRQSLEAPARWKLIEATNGYDVDSGLLQMPEGVPPKLPPYSRSGRPGQTIGRFLLVVSAARRRRRHPDWTRRSDGLERLTGPSRDSERTGSLWRTINHL